MNTQFSIFLTLISFQPGARPNAPQTASHGRDSTASSAAAGGSCAAPCRTRTAQSLDCFAPQNATRLGVRWVVPMDAAWLRLAPPAIRATKPESERLPAPDALGRLTGQFYHQPPSPALMLGHRQNGVGGDGGGCGVSGGGVWVGCGVSSGGVLGGCGVSSGSVLGGCGVTWDSAAGAWPRAWHQRAASMAESAGQAPPAA